MKTNYILKTLRRTFTKAVVKTKKHSPEILIVVGVVGTVTGTVLACKATTKLGDTLDEAKTDISKLHENEERTKKDLAVTYAKAGLKVARLYAVPTVVEVISVGCILGSHNILKGRNVTLAGGYIALETAFKEYRGGVIEKYGEKVDEELRYGIKTQKVEEVVKDPETGKEKKVKKTVEVANPLGSPYARYFDETCAGFENDEFYIKTALNTTQEYATSKIHADGFIFLNDVYDQLGIPRTKIGQIVGWVDRPDDPMRDNCVNLRAHKVFRVTETGEYEEAWLIDPNVDGNILDLI